MERFNELLKTARKAKGFTLRDVEKITGISNPYLSQLETGKINHPSSQIMAKLCAAYGLSFDEMFYNKIGNSDSDLHALLPIMTTQEKDELINYAKYIISKRNPTHIQYT